MHAFGVCAFTGKKASCHYKSPRPEWSFSPATSQPLKKLKTRSCLLITVTIKSYGTPLPSAARNYSAIFLYCSLRGNCFILSFTHPPHEARWCRMMGPFFSAHHHSGPINGRQRSSFYWPHHPIMVITYLVWESGGSILEWWVDRHHHGNGSWGEHGRSHDGVDKFRNRSTHSVCLILSPFASLGLGRVSPVSREANKILPSQIWLGNRNNKLQQKLNTWKKVYR